MSGKIYWFRCFGALACLAFVALSAGSVQAADDVRLAPHLAQFTLKNGLQLIVIPDKRAPIVTHMVWYRVGRADEEAGKSGIAHFFEHLMFKGTQKNPSGQFSKRLATLGGQENAFTSQDYTSYFQKAPKEHLKLLMEYEADRMTGLLLSEQDVATERDVVMEERRQRIENTPESLLDEAMDAALYQNHPYGVPVIGWEREIRQLNRKDAFAFYERHYTPNNALVIVAGDVEPQEVLAQAEASYGLVARRFEVAARQRPLEPPPLAARRLTLSDPKVRQPNLSRHYLAPSYAANKDGSSEALDVLAEIMGGATGRFYQALVRDKQLASSAGFGFYGTGLDYGRMSLQVTPKPGIAITQVEEAMDSVIAEVVQTGVSEEELARAKNALLAEYIYAQDSQGMMARLFGFGLMTGSSVEDIRDWPQRIQKLTRDDVLKAAKTYLDVRRSVTGLLLPSPTKLGSGAIK